jgi:hypothetical protein
MHPRAKIKNLTRKPLCVLSCHQHKIVRRKNLAVLYLAAKLRNHCAIIGAQDDQPLVAAVGDKHKGAVGTVRGKREGEERKRGHIDRKGDQEKMRQIERTKVMSCGKRKQ